MAVSRSLQELDPDLRAGFVLTNGSMSSNRSSEGAIRRALVDCMVAVPSRLSHSTPISVGLWLLEKTISLGRYRLAKSFAPL
jgi:type I restriction enzyme M protein